MLLEDLYKLKLNYFRHVTLFIAPHPYNDLFIMPKNVHYLGGAQVAYAMVVQVFNELPLQNKFQL